MSSADEAEMVEEIRQQLEVAAAKHAQSEQIKRPAAVRVVGHSRQLRNGSPDRFPRPTPALSMTPKRPSAVANALSGMLSALVAECVCFPVDTVKLQMQVSEEGDNSGALTFFMKVVGERGVRGLYKGLGASLLKEAIHNFNYWLWHDLIFRNFSEHGDTSRTRLESRLFLNLLAKWLNWLCTVPFEVVSSLNQLADDSPGFFATALRVYREGGIQNFYRGLGLSMVLAVNPAIMNTLITTELKLVSLFNTRFRGQSYEEARDHGPSRVGAAAGVAKFVATLLTYPLIRAKILQQTGAGRQKSPFQIWKAVISTEGVFGLYRGMLAMSYKTVLWNTLMMMFKHSIEPKKPITPPETPRGVDHSLTWLGRAPATIHAEKLDEILQYVRMSHSRRSSKVQDIEERLDKLSADMSEIKNCLRHLVANSPSRAHGSDA